MEGIPPIVIVLAFGLPIYLPAMTVGVIVGIWLKRPGRAAIATFLVTQLLSSVAWLIIGLAPELTVYLLLPSLSAAGLVVFFLWLRRSPGHALASAGAVIAASLLLAAFLGRSDALVANRTALALGGLVLLIAGAAGAATFRFRRRPNRQVGQGMPDEPWMRS